MIFLMIDYPSTYVLVSFATCWTYGKFERKLFLAFIALLNDFYFHDIPFLYLYKFSTTVWAFFFVCTAYF